MGKPGQADVNRLPTGSLGATKIPPPKARATRSATARPRPTPRGAVCRVRDERKNGSKICGISAGAMPAPVSSMSTNCSVELVVRAGVEPSHSVRHGVARGQEEYRRVRVDAPELSQYGQSIRPGQPSVA